MDRAAKWVCRARRLGTTIVALGGLLPGLAGPASSSEKGSAPASHASLPLPAARSALSFEQISQSALEAWNQGRDEDAISLFDRGLKLRPGWTEGVWYLGTIYYEKERFREARDLFRRYLTQNPKRGLGWALSGLCDYNLGDYVSAQEELQRANSLGVERRKEVEIAVLYHRAALFIRDGHFEQGFLELLRLRSGLQGQDQSPLEIPAGLSVLGDRLVPEEVPSQRRELARRMGTAAFARVDQRREEARVMLRELANQYPEEKGTHYQYGSFLLEEHSQAGVEEMQKVMAISPSHTGARLKLAEYYLSLSQPEQAQSYVNEVLRLEPSQPVAHLLNGQLLSAAGNIAGAIKEFEYARRMAPNDGRVLWALVRAYMTQGRRADAARVRSEIERRVGLEQKVTE